MGAPILATKPPKPPCWLDLKVQNQRSSSDEGGSRSSPVTHQHQQREQNITSRTGKPAKRMRAKIHRTRSQYCIESDDLPEDCDLTVSLAETKPKDLGLGKQVYDDRVYMQETTRKCQNWLEGVEACEPLDGVTLSSGHDLDTLECDLEHGDCVDVEVPDDTLWYDEPELRPPYNSSASSSDGEQTTNKPSRSHSKRRTTQSKYNPNIPGSQCNPSHTKTKGLKGSGKKYHYKDGLTDTAVIQ